MPAVRSAGVGIHYEVHASGPPILFITGLGYGGFYWKHLAALVEKTHQVITLDNRGSGASEKPPGPYSTRLMALDAAAVLDALGLGDVAVVGHSLGGFIAQELALARPDLVRRLALMSTTHGGPLAAPISAQALAVMVNRSLPFDELFRRGIDVSTASGWAAAHPDRVEELRAYRKSNPVPADAYAAQMMAGAMHDAYARLPSLRMPTMIYAGALDVVVPPANAALLQARIPGSRAEVLPECGHLLGWEGTDALAASLVRFLGGS